ncbi:metal ABC transporter solute-binding protein, Zn/Mn family [Leadbettera azotonutricia]|uniref:ABC-type transport system, periplasmic component n=1 Tax=Leadbettera azotonutricia (strain ATCC BAA-888 / DSM 13862 / ZAS-9) TaxID=545695 RepID=F5YG33_LEAAZ|nr:zinc ABC transporter substrate-binding protein [Leadbettera azotonutricia]AEF80364.1 ABC-type transport system, periplasmic component [Leadbettera azotonutricia ZAS-9]
MKLTERNDILKIIRIFIIVLSVVSIGCMPIKTNAAKSGNVDSKSVNSSSKPVLALSILPQDYFASRIGGDLVETLVLVGPGQSPHNYEPSPRQMADLAKAHAWILSGTEFEISLRPKIEDLFPNLLLIDGTRGVSFRSMEEHEDEDDDGDRSGIDRHTWLGLEPAKIMAFHIRDALCAADSSNAAIYQENCESLIHDMEKQFESLRNELAPLKGKTVFVYHPAFGYFLDDFDIRQEAVETGGREPTPRQLGVLIGKAKAENVKVIFVQAQFPVESARTAARAAGAELVSLDPLAGDWLANIKVMGEALARSVQTGGNP